MQTHASGFYDYPQGIYDIAVYIKEHYKDPILYVTENGNLISSWNWVCPFYASTAYCLGLLVSCLNDCFGLWLMNLYYKYIKFIYLINAGMPDNSTMSLNETLVDNLRIKYLSGHLTFLLKAIKEYGILDLW